MKSCIFIAVLACVNGDVLIEDFSKPLHKWQEMNDPVMGGRSTGSFAITDGLGVFDGEVVDVPFLKAPGFISARTAYSTFPDVSACKSLTLNLRSTVQYGGYRISFGNKHAPDGKRHASGFKANLYVNPSSTEFSTVVIPFSNFTDDWDDATGDPIHTCEENSVYCPDEATLKNMQTMALWGEGVKGPVHLEVKSIWASECASGSTPSGSSPNNNNGAKGKPDLALLAIAPMLFVGGLLLVCIALACMYKTKIKQALKRNNQSSVEEDKSEEDDAFPQTTDFSTSPNYC